MIAIPLAPASLTAPGDRIIDRFAFFRKHPFEVSDGRRFCSLSTAAEVAYGMAAGTTVTGPDGRVYTWDECRTIAAARDCHKVTMRAALSSDA